MPQRFIKPAQAGLVVRRPENGKPLPEEGASVEWSAHWQRRLDDGSVIEAEAPKAATEQPKPVAATEPAPVKKEGTK